MFILRNEDKIKYMEEKSNKISNQGKKSKSSKSKNYVGDTKIIPVRSKILIVFIILMLLLSFSTNFIALTLSRSEVITLTNKILVSQLTEIYSTAANQFQIKSYSQDQNANQNALTAITQNAKKCIADETKHNVAFGVLPTGKILFFASTVEGENWQTFTDEKNLENFNSLQEQEGSLNFISPDGEEFFGVYKYNSDWQCFIIRADLRADTQTSLYKVFGIISIVILILTLVIIGFGIGILNALLSNIKNFASAMYDMQKKAEITKIDLSNAPNDDISYLAASFNALSGTIDNIVNIFQRFVPVNVAREVRKEQSISLLGDSREITILFSDIKNFTYRTEVLGNKIFKVLTVHYDSVMNEVQKYNGVIGSIIGDAILASYGLDENIKTNKSTDAVKTAWAITTYSALHRKMMAERKIELEKDKKFSEQENREYDAMMIDVGVGIDGGLVQYGNVGSSLRMTNTVIGDNVNSASRLEGLTRIFKVPIIISKYVMQEILQDETEKDKFKFYEIATVQVKGKTEGVKIFFPLYRDNKVEGWTYDEVKSEFDIFEEGLKLYYEGDWRKAKSVMKKSKLELCKVYLENMGSSSKSPEGWKKVWEMKTK